MLVRSEIYSNFCSLSLREHDAAGRAADAGPFGHLDFLLEIALLVGDVNAVAAAVGGVDQPVVGEIKGQVADELLGHGTVRLVGVVVGLGADFATACGRRRPSRA